MLTDFICAICWTKVNAKSPSSVIEQDDGVLLQIISCLGNSIEDHMMGEQHEHTHTHEHEHEHSEACCHGDSHSEHHTASNSKSSDSRQATDPESDQESGSEEGEDDEEEEEDEEEGEGQADLVFPAMYSLALVQLLSAESAVVNVKDIKLDGDETKLDLAVTLWKEGIVAVQPQHSKKPGKKSKK